MIAIGTTLFSGGGSGGGTLTIGVYSDAGLTNPITSADFGDTVYIKAVPTGLTPTNYIFFYYNGTTITKIADQAGSTFTWVIDVALANGDVYVMAYDSVSSDRPWGLTPFEVTGDADANAYFLAAGITDQTIIDDLTPRFVSLKSSGLWDKILAWYPFKGGTASSNKYNAKDPRDLDAAFRLTFFGGWVHSAGGSLPNGTNAYANTHLIPDNEGLTNTDNHLSFNTDTSSAAVNPQFYDLGSGNTSGSILTSLWTRRAANTAAFDSGAFGSNRNSFASTDGSGFWVGAANGANSVLQKNGVTLATKALSPQASLSPFEVFIGGLNENDTLTYYSIRNCIDITIGMGLTPSEGATLEGILS